MISGLFKRLKLTKEEGVQQIPVYNKLSELFQKLIDILKLSSQQQKKRLYDDLNQLQRTAQLSQGKVLNLIEKYDQSKEQKNQQVNGNKLNRLHAIKQAISDTLSNFIKKAMGYKGINEQRNQQLDETTFCFENNHVIDEQQQNEQFQ